MYFSFPAWQPFVYLDRGFFLKGQAAFRKKTFGVFSYKKTQNSR